MVAGLDADAIATAVHAQYSRLGPTGKPQGGEWTVLAGILLSGPSGVKVVALGTGTKCLPASTIANDIAGWRLHDSHAEVCARRAFRLFLLAQIRLHGSEGDPAASVLRRLASGALELRPEWSIHFYTSQSPCGDASIFGQWEATAAAADPAERDDQPPAKRQRSACCGATAAEAEETSNGSVGCAAGATAGVVAGEAAGVSAMAGVGLAAAAVGGDAISAGVFASARPHQLGSRAPPDGDAGKRTGARPAREAEASAEALLGGAVAISGLLRGKPGRGERTCCMSCSDKLARWGVIGLQGALLSMLLPQPIVPASITAGQPCSLVALRRALRLSPASAQDPDAGDTPNGAHPPPLPQPVLMECLPHFSGGLGERPCSNSVIWHAGASGIAPAAGGRGPPPTPKQEAVNGSSGLRLGANKGSTSPKVRAAVSKASFALAFAEVCAALDHEAVAVLPPQLRGSRAGPVGYAAGGTGTAGAGTEGGIATAEGDTKGATLTAEGNAAGALAIAAAAGEAQPDPSCGASVGSARRACITADITGAPVPHQAFPPLDQAPTAMNWALPVAGACLTYRQAKQLSSAYQARKAALMAQPAFAGWVRAPAQCESFAYGLGGI